MEIFRAVESKRVYIFTAENGGLEKDGMILIRPGVKDVSIGDRKYAAVQIVVDFKYRLRGMAIYSDDIPEGYDIAVYTRHNMWDLMSEYSKQFSTIVPIDDINEPFDHDVVDIPGSRVYMCKTHLDEWDTRYHSYTKAEIDHMVKVADDLIDGRISVKAAQDKLGKIHKEFGDERVQDI